MQNPKTFITTLPDFIEIQKIQDLTAEVFSNQWLASLIFLKLEMLASLRMD